MDSRQQFEWWQCEAEDGPQVDPMWMMYDAETNTYGLDLIQSDWKTWQSSRESLVVALPDPFWPGYVEDDEPGLCISTNLFTIEQITEALADQGIRTK